MKKLSIIASVMLLCAFVAQAATFTISTNIPANRTIQLIGAGAIINQITVDNTNAATVARVYFYGAPGTNTFFTSGIYTNYTFTVGTFTNFYTNFVGTLTTNTWAANVRTTNSVAAATNSYPLVWQANLGGFGTNNVSTYTPPVPLPAPLGLIITNSAAVNITITYDQ